MTEDRKLTQGMVGWTDLTVRDGTRTAEFYREVLSVNLHAVDMGGYEDFVLVPDHGGTPGAGVCHARGPNRDLPPVWMVYFVVDDLDAALERVQQAGGEVLRRPSPEPSDHRYGVIRDVAGAVCALIQGQSATSP